MTVKITVDYIGTKYHGWQRQNCTDTIQERLENAVKSLTGQSVTVHGSGRTDAGVHALAQVAHFEMEDRGRNYNFVKGLNNYLPDDIRVLDAEIEDESFHARFSAHKKTYEYVIYESKTDRSVFRDRALRIYYPVDINKMNEVAETLKGSHDFSSFMSSGSCVSSAVRELYELKAEKRGEFLIVTATANGFLYNMVRRLVSVLLKAGKGEMSVNDVKRILEAKDGKLIKDIVPACGLYLKSVDYGI